MKKLSHVCVPALASAVLAGTCLSIASADGLCQARWHNAIGQPGMGGGPDPLPAVLALKVFDDGSGDALYAGGTFTTAGAADASRVARWDGTQWSPLGSGVNDAVIGLTVFDDGSGPALFAGGIFTMAGDAQANYIAKWDGSSWSPLGTGVTGPGLIQVRSMAVFDDGGGPALYVGGSFTSAGGVPASRIARWNGSSWSAVGGGVNSTVYALKVFDDGNGPALYAGGNFTTAGGVAVNRVAKWDGSQWSALGGGMNDIVHVLTAFDGSLHAAGNFVAADGMTVNHVARWDGSQWSALGSGLDERVRTLAVFDTNPGSPGDGESLYAGGIFQNAGAVSASRIARWDGSHWAPLGGGVNTWVRALAVFDPGRGPGLYAGGEFTLAGGQPASRIAEWRLATRSGPSDLNCDGVVDVLDLLILLDAWGKCKDCGNCLGDLNNDCTVDVLDLLMLLDDWG